MFDLITKKLVSPALWLFTLLLTLAGIIQPLARVKQPEGRVESREHEAIALDLRRRCMRDVMQVRSQGFVPACRRAVINEGNNRNSDILFNGFEQSFADHCGAAEQRIDMDKKGDLLIMVEQAEDLQDIMGGFPAVDQ